MHFNVTRYREQCCRRMLPTQTACNRQAKPGNITPRSTTGPHHTRTSLMRTMQGKMRTQCEIEFNDITHTNLHPAEHEMNTSTNWKLVLHDSSYDSRAILAFDTMHIERAAHKCSIEFLYSISSNELNGAAMQQRASGMQTQCSCMHSPLLA